MDLGNWLLYVKVCVIAFVCLFVFRKVLEVILVIKKRKGG